MRSTLLTMLLTMLFAVGGLALAQHDEHGDGNVRVLSQKEMTEKLDGKKTKATTVEVSLGPGELSAPHRHPGPVFGYVAEGEYEWAIDDNPVQTLKAGDTFYEPSGCLHRVSKNASDKNKARVIAVVLHPHDVNDIVIPVNAKKN